MHIFISMQTPRQTKPKACEMTSFEASRFHMREPLDATLTFTQDM